MSLVYSTSPSINNQQVAVTISDAVRFADFTIDHPWIYPDSSDFIIRNCDRAQYRESSSSAPSVDIGKLFHLSKIENATKPPGQKKTCVLILVDGIPLIIAPTAETASQTKLTQENSNIPSVTLAESLDLIKDRLALSITQMSELFGVTRKAVYDWYEGAEPRAAMTNRIVTLIDIINTARPETDLQRLKTVWNIPVSGRSFIMVFGDDGIGIDTLRTMLVEKLDDLSPRMVKKTNSTQKTTSQLGESRLAEFDRTADFG